MNKTPALISFLWPKNLGVLLRYLEVSGPRTIITTRSFFGAEHLSKLRSANASPLVLDDVLSKTRRDALKRHEARLIEQLDDWAKPLLSATQTENDARQLTLGNARANLGSAIELIAALDEVASEHAIELVVLNEEWMLHSNVLCMWARHKGIPTLHLEHNPFLGLPYSIHQHQQADHMAVFGEGSQASFSDVGYDISRLHATGLPQFDALMAERERRAYWRDFICSRHGLDPSRPIIVYGTTWFAGLSLLEDADNPTRVTEAFFGAIKSLGKQAQHIIKDRPGAGPHAEKLVRGIAHRLGIRDRDYVYVQDAIDGQGIPMEKPLPYLLGADLIVANDSGLLIEALCVQTRGVNLLTDSTFVFGPYLAGDCGLRQATADKLADTILKTLDDPEIPAQMAAAAPRFNAAMDGCATERVAMLMRQLALPTPRLIPFEPDPSLRRKAPPPAWKTLLQVEDTAATGYHGGVRRELVDLSPRPIRLALDIGCAAGGTGAYIKSKHPPARVIGIEVNRSAAELAKKQLDQVLVGRFEEIDFAAAGVKPGSIDTVIVADVLEHMYDPWSVLTALRPWLSMDAQVIASIPNVRNLKLMEDMAAGYWRYEDSGLLDITHIRFFTLREVRRFFHETGYHVRTLQYAIDPRLMAFYEENKPRPGPIDINMGKMSLHAIEGAELDELCSLQFYVVAGNNARTDDIENYRETPPDLLLLERLAPTPQDGRLWEEHLAHWPKLPEVHLFLIDTVGDETRIAATIGNLARQLYSSARITVVSPKTAPDGVAVPGGRIGWRELPAGQSPFVLINEEIVRSGSDWVAPLYAGDVVEPAALLRLIELARRTPDARCLYGDDSVLINNIPSQLKLKPDFDAELLLGWDYLSSGLTLFERATLLSGGGFAADLRGAEVYDAALRLLARHGSGSFAHLAEPLLHRPPGGNDGDLPFSQVHGSRRAALGRHFVATAIPAQIDDGWTPGTFRIRRQPAADTSVSLLLVLDATTPPFQQNLERTLECTTTLGWEVLILDNGVSDPVIREYVDGLDALQSAQLRIFRLDTPAGSVQASNLLAEQARGELLVFLDPRLHPATKGWLEELGGLTMDAGVAAVAPRILGADGKVFASGLFVGIEDGAADAFAGALHQQAGILGRAHLVQRFAALPDGCLLTKKVVFEAAGGFDVAAADTLALAVADYTLRLTAAGLRCLWTPFVSLLRTATSEAAPREPVLAFSDELLLRHLPLLRHDPAYHPALASKTPVFSYEKRRELIGERFPWRPLPRILAFHADLGGCGYYRIIEPAKALTEAHRAEANATCYTFDSVDIARADPDIVVLQRQIMDEQIARVERYRRVNGKPLVFELDDLMFELPKHNPHNQETPKDIKERLRRSIGVCDRLIVSTAPLAEALREMNGDIRVVANRLPKSRWEGLAPARQQRKKPRVGWSGSISHVGDLLIIEDIVRELADEVDWVFMGLAPDALRPFIADFRPGVPFAEYPDALADMQLDLALAPLELCHFNECKSNLKLLEYGILGYPVIATDIVPYQGDLPITRVKNKRTHWVRAIREHLSDRDELARRGDAMKAAVTRDWMLEEHLDEWLDAWTMR
ncbi:methyltransferase [Rhodocyclus tenuis]|uniref:methyltransferase n=1 Tax=Rhodocyclus tenuis TaxID=1066 RepID=UPI001907B266|nr:methyltransferase domain-containing protein [Rhodocyclus tenuis]MBK1679960.1 hypothetical protein [Rhodocyclus tenuis]